jgi:hypothetical protein
MASSRRRRTPRNTQPRLRLRAPPRRPHRPRHRTQKPTPTPAARRLCHNLTAHRQARASSPLSPRHSSTTKSSPPPPAAPSFRQAYADQDASQSPAPATWPDRSHGAASRPASPPSPPAPPAPTPLLDASEAAGSSRPPPAITPYQARQIRSLRRRHRPDQATHRRLGRAARHPRSQTSRARPVDQAPHPRPASPRPTSQKRQSSSSPPPAPPATRLYGEGGALGPDLTGSDRRNLVLPPRATSCDPTAVVPADYRMTLLQAQRRPHPHRRHPRPNRPHPHPPNPRRTPHPREKPNHLPTTTPHLLHARRPPRRPRRRPSPPPHRLPDVHQPTVGQTRGVTPTSLKSAISAAQLSSSTTSLTAVKKRR